MNKKRIILLSLIIALLATEPMILGVESRTDQISRAQAAFQTFRNDMSCLFSSTKKCTRKQKQRIAAEAVGLVITVAALTGAGIWSWKVIKQKQAEKRRHEAAQSAELEARMQEEQVKWTEKKARAEVQEREEYTHWLIQKLNMEKSGGHGLIGFQILAFSNGRLINSKYFVEKATLSYYYTFKLPDEKDPQREIMVFVRERSDIPQEIQNTNRYDEFQKNEAGEWKQVLYAQP